LERQLLLFFVSSILLICLFFNPTQEQYVAVLVGENHGSSYLREDLNYVYIGNDFVEIVLNKANKGGIRSILDKATGTDFVANKSAWWSMYDFCYMQNNELQYATGEQASGFSYQSASLQNGIVVNLTWNFITRNIAVDVCVTLYDNSSLTFWILNLRNQGNLAIEAVDFPSLNGVGQISKNASNDYLAYPSIMGLLFQDPTHNFEKNRGWGWNLNYPSFYSMMQFIAYYSSENHAGLYMAAYDTNGYSKFINIGRPEDWMSIYIRYTPPLVQGSSVYVPYPVVIGVFSGDWYTAAQIYRDWATSQWWCSQGPLSNRTDTPDVFKRMAAMSIFLNHLNATTVVRDATPSEIVKVATDYLNMPILMSWWGWERDGWYENYPEVLPPYEGWQAFDETVNGIHKNNGDLFAIICADLYSMNVSSWESAQAYAIRNRDTSLVVFEMSPPLVTHYALMDPSTQFFQETIVNLTLALVRHGVDCVQLDGFPVVPPYPCYDIDHGHPAGGGNWWFSGYRDMMQKIRFEARKINPDFAMGAEGMAEVYIPYFDSFNDPVVTGISPTSFSGAVKDVSMVEFVPLWQTVYHDYIISYSSLTFLTPANPYGGGYGTYKDFYTWGLGMSLMNGEIPQVWADGKDFLSLDPKMADYFRRITQARFTYASQFLTYGQLMPCPLINGPIVQISGAKSIPYSLADYPSFNTSSILSSCWRTPQGIIADILTNIGASDVEMNQTLEVPLLTPCNVTMLRNGKVEWRGIVDNKSCELNLTVKPLDVVLLIFGDLRDIWMKADLNFDGVVNILDISIVARAFGTRPGDPSWNETADLDKNGTVNIIDVTMVARDYGKTV
jgi:hypothetical protein